MLRHQNLTSLDDSSLLIYSLLFSYLLQAGLLHPDTVEASTVEIPEFNVSYKPQKIATKFESTVSDLLHQKIRGHMCTLSSFLT